MLSPWTILNRVTFRLMQRLVCARYQLLSSRDHIANGRCPIYKDQGPSSIAFAGKHREFRQLSRASRASRTPQTRELQYSRACDWSTGSNHRCPFIKHGDQTTGTVQGQFSVQTAADLRKSRVTLTRSQPSSKPRIRNRTRREGTFGCTVSTRPSYPPHLLREA